MLNESIHINIGLNEITVQKIENLCVNTELIINIKKQK